MKIIDSKDKITATSSSNYELYEHFLTETIEFLKENGKKPQDVCWIGINNECCSWYEFSQIANFYYDSGFGSQDINKDLIIAGDNWWIERHEYDGSEWWEFKTMPSKPIINRRDVTNNSLELPNFDETIPNDGETVIIYYKVIANYRSEDERFIVGHENTQISIRNVMGWIRLPEFTKSRIGN